MEGRGQRKQDLAQIIKEQPEAHAAQQELENPEDFTEMNRPRHGGYGRFSQTRRTQDAIFVFGNTFSAEISATFRTSRNGLTELVIEASLMRKIIH